MYCSKCKFTSFDHPSACPKCGVEWNVFKEKLNLSWITAPGYDWIAGGQAHAPENHDGSAADPETASSSFPFEDQLKTPSRSASLQELSFDEFEEVNIGEADNEPFALNKQHPAHADPGLDDFLTDSPAAEMPEVSMTDDLGDTLLNQVDDVANLELDLDEFSDEVPQKAEQDPIARDDSTDFSLDDLDLELEDLVQEASRKR
jgi:hypothetical protein